MALLANWRIIAAGALLAGLIGAWAYIGHLQKVAAVARSERDAAVAYAEQLTKARNDETQAARDDYNAQAEACRSDLLQAVGRGRTIERIIQTPATVNADGTVQRSIIGADQLRNIVGQ